jgi:hypothetical protein
LVTLVAPVAMPSNLVLSEAVNTPAASWVAAEISALVPSELLIVTVVEANVVVRFVLTLGAALLNTVPVKVMPEPAV